VRMRLMVTAVNNSVSVNFTPPPLQHTPYCQSESLVIVVVVIVREGK